MLWNDKRTPPGVYTDSHTGVPQVGMTSPKTSWYPAGHDPVAARNAALGQARSTMSGPPRAGGFATPSSTSFGGPHYRPSQREQFNALMDAHKPSQTMGEKLANRVIPKMGDEVITTKRGNKLRAKGKLNPLR